MKVFKFGGASVNSVERIQNLGKIVSNAEKGPLVIIISAMGKTTNGLEKVAESFFEGRQEEALQLFQTIRQYHTNIAKYLLVTRFNECLKQLTDFFTEVEWLLHDKPVREYDYYYDQIVSTGELLSTSIISHYLNETGIANKWMDVRDLIRTDNNFRDATVDWEETSDRVLNALTIQPGTQESGMWVTQGFIGSTDANESTTLGREGSDFSAAIFANILDAGSLVIWKDVIGIMNADPKEFPDAQLIPELNYTEVIEMAFYGAQVIHPKTIKPLQNKKITLYVKCFLDPSLPGTLIHITSLKQLPPIIVLKKNQALIHLKSRDFSFVGEEPMSRLYEIFGHLTIKPNLIQTGAINVQVCLDDRSDKIEQFAFEASKLFDVRVEKNLELLSIRHYTVEVFEKLTIGKTRVLTQRTPETVQTLYSVN